jgi:signal transduction histidine kinase
VTTNVGGGSRPARVADVVLVALILVLALGTATIVVAPTVVAGVVDERLDVALATAALLVSFAVAALAWARARVQRDAPALLRAAGFAVLATLNGLTIAVMILGADAAVGASLDEPGELPILAGLLARGVCAVLLVAAGIATVRGARPRAASTWLVVTPTLAVAAVLAVAAAAPDRTPAVAGPQFLDRLAADPTEVLALGSAPVLATVQGLIGAGFLAAAFLEHRSYRRRGRIADALMAAGLVIAAFSQVHGAMHPGGYVALVTTGDLLRLAFYATLLAAIVADSRDDLRALRRANVEVRRLADAQLATIALEERARLAREIHDGLAQALWYAKLKQSRLAQLADFSGETRRLSDEVGDAIDAGLAEARHAVAAMRAGAETGPFLEVLARQVEDFTDRFALRAELTVDGPEPQIGPREQAEVLRIVQEALTNVRKHADATVVRIRVESDGELRVLVADNGRGFHTAGDTDGGFGLESMRQRASTIGATLAITSEPRNGTRVVLTVPIASRGVPHG